VTTLNEANAALYQRLNDNFSTAPFVLDNEPDGRATPVQATGKPWVRAAVRHLERQQETLGRAPNRKYWNEGIFLLQVFTPKGEGRYTSDVLVEELRGIFEGASFDGVTVNNVLARESGPHEDEYLVVMEAAFVYYQTR
tara:strand:+ start:31605 stop:32021 length:417 start_codon:yes stop_codon:yes gene_type:complete